MRGTLTVLEHQDQLDQSRDARGALQMSDVGLDGTQHQGRRQRAVLAKNRPQRLDLDGISQPRTRSMRLDVPDLPRRQARIPQRPMQHGFLSRSVGSRQAIAAAVVVHRRTADECQDPVARGHCVAQSFEHDHATPLASHVPVGSRVERLATTVRRHHLRLAQGNRRRGTEQQVHTARQCQIRLALAKTAACQMHRDQRRGTGRVQCQARTMQVQHVRQPICQDRVTDPCPREDVHVRQIAGLQQGIVVADHANVHPRARLAERSRGYPRMLQRLPGHLHQQPLLGIHSDCLPRRDPEEVGIELVHPIQETAPARVHFSGDRAVRVVVLVQIPTVGGNFPDGVRTVFQQAPILGGSIGLRKPASQSDDRDRFRSRLLLGGKLRLGFLQ